MGCINPNSSGFIIGHRFTMVYQIILLAFTTLLHGFTWFFSESFEAKLPSNISLILPMSEKPKTGGISVAGRPLAVM